jgi:hypothetical protein
LRFAAKKQKEKYQTESPERRAVVWKGDGTGNEYPSGAEKVKQS